MGKIKIKDPINVPSNSIQIIFMLISKI